MYLTMLISIQTIYLYLKGVRETILLKKWHIDISSSPKLDYNAKFKENFCYEDYLDKFKNEKFKNMAKTYTCIFIAVLP